MKPSFEVKTIHFPLTASCRIHPGKDSKAFIRIERLLQGFGIKASEHALIDILEERQCVTQLSIEDLRD